MPILSANPLEPMQAMSAYIMEVQSPATRRGAQSNIESIFAVGLLLFMFTLVVEPASPRALIARKFREVYE